MTKPTSTLIQNFLILFLILFGQSCDNFDSRIADAITGASKGMPKGGNSLFHQTDETSLETTDLEVVGEVQKPGFVDFKKHYKREVMVKESFHDGEQIQFIGAYRYRGYSLFDLLNSFNLQKKNVELFKPAIDLYITIENDKQENVVFSWSEIFHTNSPHQILIATEMAPIVPYRKDVDYPVATSWKVVSANDLYSYRSIENPVRIIVSSFDQKQYPIDRDMSPLYSDGLDVYFEDELLKRISDSAHNNHKIIYESSFYGMGMGSHPSDPFIGPDLNSQLEGLLDFRDKNLIKHGLVCFAGLDGYRTIYSFSELFNRTDQVRSILDITPMPDEGGYYRIFHPADFYADRSVKALKEMYVFLKD